MCFVHIAKKMQTKNNKGENLFKTNDYSYHKSFREFNKPKSTANFFNQANAINVKKIDLI